MGSLGKCDGSGNRQLCNAKGLRLGTLNVVSLNRKGRLNELIDMMKRRNIHILGLSETKWLGNGQKHITEGFEIIWSGDEQRKLKLYHW